MCQSSKIRLLILVWFKNKNRSSETASPCPDQSVGLVTHIGLAPGFSGSKPTPFSPGHHECLRQVIAASSEGYVSNGGG